MAKRWYSVSVLSNFEKKVAESIKEAVRQQGLEDEIEILVDDDRGATPAVAKAISRTSSEKRWITAEAR